ncbi:MAG: hypothetical protein H0T47_06880 [Planctomycetaceae bacterium]|nr:hypothetical protein [Planctomycetaceae bacterium]
MKAVTLAGRRRKSIDEASVPLQGTRLVRRMRSLLARLHSAGCARDLAGNRKLFFDDYACLLLLYFFIIPPSTACGTGRLRALQQVSGWEKTREKLGIRRAALGSLSPEAADDKLSALSRAGQGGPPREAQT